jgi:branched-chain amino acid transport system ATP-binding protein
VLSSKGLSKHFDGVVAADGVSLEVAPGERVGLIGSNGAGKTTFVNMITGYLKPDAGSITVDGRDITGLGPREITRLGVARSFQIPQLCAEMSVLENMLMAQVCSSESLSFLQPFRSPEKIEQAAAILERFAIAQHARRRVAELAGGVRKLLDIALALTHRPKLLLLDEPTSGVSVEEKLPLMDTLMAALDEGDAAAGNGAKTTVLFVEHDMEVVTRYAGRVVAFYSGRVLADGAPATVLSDADVRRHVTGAEA